MSLLLDTHVLLWALLEPKKLSPTVKKLLEDPATKIYISAASAWEIGTKYRLGKLSTAANVVHDYQAHLNTLRSEELAVDSNHALTAALWKLQHRDPFDRILAAQAKLEKLRLVSTDKAFATFGVSLLW